MALARLLLIVAAFALALAGCAEPAPLKDPAKNETPPGTGTGTDGGVGATSCDDADVADPGPTAEKPQVRVVTSEGAFTVELEREKAPVTVNNFLDLACSGSYDGTLFHRVIGPAKTPPDGFMIQGGDPNSRDADPSNDGGGGPGYVIPDEFNPTLRHEGPGILSMANAGPNTGGSQFFVTLASTRYLDDRHSVFGKVVEGMEVVRAIGSVQTNEDDRPLSPVSVTRVEVLEATPYTAEHALQVVPLVPVKKAEAGRAVRFAVVVQNDGNVRENVNVTATAPPGWTVSSEEGVVNAGTGRVFFVSVTPGAEATGANAVGIKASSPAAQGEGSVRVDIATLGAQVGQGDQVTANYAGVLADGRLFDTSMAAVGGNADLVPFGFTPKPSYQSFPFTVGSGVIQGFTDLAVTAKEGETVTGYIPAAKAYGERGQHRLAGRDLVFELEILKVG